MSFYPKRGTLSFPWDEDRAIQDNGSYWSEPDASEYFSAVCEGHQVATSEDCALDVFELLDESAHCDLSEGQRVIEPLPIGEEGRRLKAAEAKLRELNDEQ